VTGQRAAAGTPAPSNGVRSGPASGPRPVVVLLRGADRTDESGQLAPSTHGRDLTQKPICWSTADRSSGSRAGHSTVKEPFMTLISTTTPPVGTR
jgi:hypothetical protein